MPPSVPTKPTTVMLRRPVPLRKRNMSFKESPAYTVILPPVNEANCTIVDPVFVTVNIPPVVILLTVTGFEIAVTVMLTSFTDKLTVPVPRPATALAVNDVPIVFDEAPFSVKLVVPRLTIV